MQKTTLYVGSDLNGQLGNIRSFLGEVNTYRQNYVGASRWDDPHLMGYLSDLRVYKEAADDTAAYTIAADMATPAPAFNDGGALIGRYFSTDNVWYDAARGANGVQWQAGDFPVYHSSDGWTYFNNSMYVRLENENLFADVTRDTGLTFAFDYVPNFSGEHRHIISLGQNAYGDGTENQFFISGTNSWYSNGKMPVVAWMNGGSETIKAYPDGVTPVQGKEYSIVVSIDKDDGVVFYVDGVKKNTVYVDSDLNGQIGNVRGFLDAVHNYKQNYVGCSRWTSDAKIDGLLRDVCIYRDTFTDDETRAMLAGRSSVQIDLTAPAFNAPAYHYNDVATGGYANLAYADRGEGDEHKPAIRGADNSEDYKDIYAVYLKFFNPRYAVMVYDGEHDTYAPIQLETKRNNKANVQDQRIYYVVSNSSLFKTMQNWKGYMDSSWTTWAGGYSANEINTDPSLDVYVGSTNDTPRFWWNGVKYFGSGNTESYYDHESNVSYTIQAFFDYTIGGTSKGTGTITTLSDYYVLNYQPVYSVLSAAGAKYGDEMVGKQWMYTEDSYARAMLAMRRLTLCAPNRYDYEFRGVDISVQFSAAAIKQAAADYAAINLVKKTGDVIFRNEDGTEYRRFDGVEYGEAVTAPAVPAKDYDDTFHYTDARWDMDYPIVRDPETVITAAYTAVAHDWRDAVDTPATCGAPGVKHEACTGCDAVRNENTVIPATGAHTLVPTAAVDPSCTEAGNTAYWTCGVCGKFFADENGENEIAENSWVLNATGHTLTATPAKAASCTEAGNTAYWTCETCGKFFADENGENEIAENSWVLNATGHTLTATPAKAATCTEAGNTAYWTCGVCGKFFADENGENEIAENSWVLNATGHTLTATPAKAASCTEAGNTAYWTCETCGKFFADENGENEIAENSWVLNATGHTLTATPAKAASCTEAGNTAYWTCGVCGKFFADENGENEIAENSWVLEKDYTVHATAETVLKNEKAPGYTFAGYTGDRYCAACDRIVETGREIARLNIDENAVVAAAKAVHADAADDPTMYEPADVTALNDKLAELNAALAIDDNDDAVNTIITELDDILADMDAIVYFNVTFLVDGAAVGETQRVRAGENAEAPEQAAYLNDGETHRAFSGWNGDYTNVTADLEITATYDVEAHSWTDGEITLTPTCSAKGAQARSCVCGATGERNWRRIPPTTPITAQKR